MTESIQRIYFLIYLCANTKRNGAYGYKTPNIDLFPTFAEISGAPLPTRKIDGVSILSLMEGKPGANPRESFVYYYNKNDLEAVTDGMFKLVFPHKYTTYGAYEPGNDGQPGKLISLEVMKPELYDLRRDPGERYNVISQYPEVARKLMTIADQKREELGDNLTRKKGKERREPHEVPPTRNSYVITYVAGQRLTITTQHANRPAHFGIRTDRYKLMFLYGDPLEMTGSEAQSVAPAWEFHDLQADPHEDRNDYNNPAYSDIIKQLKRDLLKLRTQYGDEDKQRPRMQEILRSYY